MKLEGEGLLLLLWDFDTLELQHLSREDARRLLHVQIEQLSLRIPDVREFERAVWRLTHGNPRVIVALCTQAVKGRYVFGRHLDSKLLDWDRRINQLRP